ncbi:hypothetical protein OSTOST_15891 [Ostertagia ostertagi]
MERFLSALIVIGVTLNFFKGLPSGARTKKAWIWEPYIGRHTCHPGSLRSEFNPAFHEYFPQMDIEQRSKKLGKFTDLGSADVGGKFAFTFKLLNSDCEKVSHWLDDIKKSESVITSTSMKCVGQQQ